MGGQHRPYTRQFKEQAVGMVKNGRSVPEVSRALGLVEQTLRNWVKLAGKRRQPGSAAAQRGTGFALIRAIHAEVRCALTVRRVCSMSCAHMAFGWAKRVWSG